MSEPTTATSSPVRRTELQVAAAMAREAVLQLHVERALELIALAEGRVSPLRMVEIYVRLLSLTGTARDVVVNRALAALGQRASSSAAASLAALAGDDEPSAWRSLRRRLRGRVHNELRYAVELHTGVTQKTLLELHVDHAHRFVGLFADTQRLNEACSLYIDLVGVPGAHKQLLYPLVLAHIASHELPRTLSPVPDSSALARPARGRAPSRSGLRTPAARQPA